MAYFNGYQPAFQPVYQQAPVQMPGPQNQGGIIWVQGETAAKSYLVAPGNTVALWDSEEKTIYLKSADASGMPSIRILDYTIRGEEPAKPAPEYATKADLEALAEKVQQLAIKKKPRVIREEDDDE